MKIRCLIVDDEPLARRVLEKYIKSIPSLTLIHQCSNAIEAAAYLHQHEVDVIFLDIHMPELSGLDFLKIMNNPPKIIITTAYSEYALQGYEYSVTDYLLKPISFERFLKAINKLTPDVVDKKNQNYKNEIDPMSDFIFLRADKIDHRVLFSEIQLIEGCGNFIKVYTDDKMLMVAETMSDIEENLPSERFIRVHKSFIVSINRITQIEGNMVKIGDRVIPIGKYYKQTVEKIIDKYHLKK